MSQACLCSQWDFNKAKNSLLIPHRSNEQTNFESMCFHIPHVLLFFAKSLFLTMWPSSWPSPTWLFSCVRSVLLAIALSLLNQLIHAKRAQSSQGHRGIQISSINSELHRYWSATTILPDSFSTFPTTTHRWLKKSMILNTYTILSIQIN